MSAETDRRDGRACCSNAGKTDLNRSRDRSWLTAFAFAVAALSFDPARACEYAPGPPGSRIVETKTGDGPVRAWFIGSTNRYAHRVLGDEWEAAGIAVQTRTDLTTGACGATYMLPRSAVFEDVAPRISDLDQDGRNEIIVVESDIDSGARLSVFGLLDNKLERIAATQPIGRRFRWLAPVGIADFDGDGITDIAYVETPHLGKTLRVVSFRDGQLVELASRSGHSNHRIGETWISGGVRQCGQNPPEIVTANADWTQIIVSQVSDGKIVTRAANGKPGPGSFGAALECR